MGAKKKIEENGTSVNSAAVTGLGVIASIAANAITANAHGLNNGDQVQFVNSGGALPTGISAGTGYFVVGKTTNTFQIATTQGGGAATISGGTGTTTIKVVVNGFAIFSASTAGTQKTNVLQLTSPDLLALGDMLNVAHQAIWLALGVTGTGNAFTDARLAAMLDTELASGDYIAWFSNYGTATPSELGVLARTTVTAWEAAAAF
jgi:hypothetical protein